MVSSENCLYQPDKSCLGLEDVCPEDCKYKIPAECPLTGIPLSEVMRNPNLGLLSIIAMMALLRKRQAD